MRSPPISMAGWVPQAPNPELVTTSPRCWENLDPRSTCLIPRSFSHCRSTSHLADRGNCHSWGLADETTVRRLLPTLLERCFFSASEMYLTRKGILRAIWVFSLLAWGYVIIDRWINPQLQKDLISAYVPIPQDLAGIVAFGVGFVSFALWSSTEK